MQICNLGGKNSTVVHVFSWPHSAPDTAAGCSSTKIRKSLANENMNDRRGVKRSGMEESAIMAVSGIKSIES